MGYDVFGNWVPDGGGNSSASAEKTQNLNESLYQKMIRLGTKSDGSSRNKNVYDNPLNQGASLDNSYSMTPGGPVSNRGIIQNDYNQAEMNQFGSDLYDQRPVQDEDGYLYLLDSKGNRQYLEDQNPDMSSLYNADNVAGTEDKFGKAEFGFKPRYTPGLANAQGIPGAKPSYGWPTGPEGVDTSKDPNLNWRLQQQNVEKAEAIALGNSANLARKPFYDDGSIEAKKERDRRGGGASEFREKEEGLGLFGGTKTPKGQEPTMRNVFDEAGLTRFKTVGNRGQVKHKPLESMTEKEKTLYYMSKADEISDKISSAREADGRFVSNAKGAFGSFANIVTNVADSATEGLTAAAKAAGVITDEEEKFMDSIFDSSKEDWNERLGVNTTHVDKANEALATKVADGDYLGAAGQVMKDLDIHLAQSIPEMGMLALKIPGLLATVNSRVKEQSTEFVATNGREPTNAEKAGMWASNAAVLVPEQLLLVGPLKSIYKAARAGSAGTKSGFQFAGQTIGKKAGNVAKTVGFEAVQEAADQTQEQFWRKGGSGDVKGGDAFVEAARRVAAGEVISKNELIAASIAGGVMGGALRGAGELPGSAKAVGNTFGVRAFKKSLTDMDTYLDETDKKFEQMSLANESEEIDGARADIKEAQAQITAAKKSKNLTIDELSKSDNKFIKKYVSEVKSTYIDANTDTLDYKSKGNLNSVALTKAIVDSSSVVDIGINETEYNKASIEEQQVLIENALKQKDARSKFVKSLSVEEKENLFNTAIDEKGKKAFNSEYEGSFEKELNRQDSGLAQRKGNLEYVKEKINTKKNLQQKTGKINLKGNVNNVPKLRNLISTLTRTNARKKVARAEINKYTNTAIKEAMSTATPNESALMQEVLDNRESAKGKAGIGNKFEVSSEKYEAVKPNESLGKNKAESIKALRAIMGRSEFRNFDETKNAQELIDKAFEAKHINKSQKKILENRLDKIAVKTKSRELKEEEASRKSNEAAKDFFKNETAEEATERGNKEKRLYKFKDYSGREYEGEIIFDDKNDGKFHVEFEKDGEKVVVQFGNKKGNQIFQTGVPVEYLSGYEYKKSEDKKEDTDTGTTEEDTGADSSNDEEGSDLIAEAARKANNLTLGREDIDFDVEDLSDEEIKEMSDILNVLFDC